MDSLFAGLTQVTLMPLQLLLSSTLPPSLLYFSEPYNILHSIQKTINDSIKLVGFDQGSGIAMLCLTLLPVNL